MHKLSFAVACLFLATACSENNNTTPEPSDFNFDFESNNQDWVGNFADYPEGDSAFYELQYSYSTLPSPLDSTEGALKLSGNNHSDDLFMYAKKQISGLQPNTKYAATFTLELATNAADNSVGIGGSPASSVYVKAGLTDTEPKSSTLDSLNHYRMNIDKGNQSGGGTDMIVLGDLSNGQSEEVYVLKTLTNTTPFEATTDAEGKLWFIVGTDSGYEGISTVYYNKIGVHVEQK
ncbi:hypothetical protein LAG90_13560 [Marinilongibacter aquaticus]|uniref:hypothetical protein n=1 Tax=Marinilongibacter aquaticus TaxID=2975157 RepID=UPI0021BD8076|nr:hypothetical protein [Marinilongibacter aquaticus]UBM57832.1 hypothetical protein LAG90_13560 [Marinilongibacter aquaticus]